MKKDKIQEVMAWIDYSAIIWIPLIICIYLYFTGYKI